MDNHEIDLEMMLKNHNYRKASVFLIITEATFIEILEEIPRVILSAYKSIEAIKALKLMYYDFKEARIVCGGLCDVSNERLRQAFRVAYLKVIKGLNLPLFGLLERYKRIDLYMVKKSGAVLRELDKRGENVTNWCLRHSIILI